MDGSGFDRLSRSLAQGQSRRAVVKRLLGLGGAAALGGMATGEVGAQSRPQLCQPQSDGSYRLRSVFRTMVAYYKARGWVEPVNGVCPTCQAGLLACDGGCTDAYCGSCGTTCGYGATCQNGQCDCAPGFCDTGNGCVRGQCCSTAADCEGDDFCVNGLCGPCVPVCTGRQCGDDDGCGGTCDGNPASNPAVSLTFEPTNDPGFCFIVVTLSGFAGCTVYKASLFGTDPIPSLNRTDIVGSSVTQSVSYLRGDSVFVTVDGVQSPVTTIDC